MLIELNDIELNALYKLYEPSTLNPKYSDLSGIPFWDWVRGVGNETSLTIRRFNQKLIENGKIK